MPEIGGVPVTQEVYDDLMARRHESKKPIEWGLYSLFLFLALLSLGLRLWVQYLKRQRLRRDDYAAIAATFFYLCNTILNLLGSIIADFGFHNTAIRPLSYKTGPMVGYLGSISYTLTWPMTKIAIILLYLRIFPQKWFRMLCHFLLVILTIYIVGTFFVDVFACRPIRKAYELGVEGKCIKFPMLVLSTAAANVAIDFTILLMVQIPIWRLCTTLRQKVGLSLIFGLGGLACAASVVRITINIGNEKPGNPTLYDGLWYISANIWANVELMLCILCANLPTCSPIIDLFRGKSHRLFSRAKPSMESSPTGTHTRNGKPAAMNRHGRLDDGLTPNGKSAKITTGATADTRFEEMPGEEDATQLNSINVKSEVKQWDSEDDKKS